MADKPQSISFSDFVKTHTEQFVPYELWVSDELADYFVLKKDLDPDYTSVVVDLDSEDPIAKVEGDSVFIRLNGRFYIPKTDEKDNKLTVEPSEWIELSQKWFDENEIEVTFDEESVDLIKFTALLPALALPEGLETPNDEEGASEGPDGSEESENIGEEEKVSDELADEEKVNDELGTDTKDKEVEDKPVDSGGTEDNEDLAEFEKALGI